MQKTNKKCPRCDAKMPVSAMICPRCELNFKKFDTATNEAGKKALNEGRKQDVVFRKGCPKDVSKTKLILLAVFLGFTGAHNYFVGRNKKGLFYTIFFLVGVVNAVLTAVVKSALTGWVKEIFTILVLIWGVVLVMWLFDVLNIIFDNYKIPVSIDLEK